MERTVEIEDRKAFGAEKGGRIGKGPWAANRTWDSASTLVAQKKCADMDFLLWKHTFSIQLCQVSKLFQSIKTFQNKNVNLAVYIRPNHLFFNDVWWCVQVLNWQQTNRQNMLPFVIE